MATIQSSSSITTIPPEPMIEPFLLKVSKSIGVSRSFSVKHPPDGPPVCTALNFLLSLIPPPISNIISLKVIPIGTSTSPTLLIFPAKANTFVPGDFSVPTSLNHSFPCKSIPGTFTKVSTLFTTVGLFQNPFSAGYGGLEVGSPLLPSIE